MMDAIITPIITVVCTALGSLVTWLLSRKKYHTEVEHNNIENMEGSLEFYEKLTDSSNNILTDLLKKYEKVIKTNLELVAQIQDLKTQICILTEVIKNEVEGADFNKYGIIINENGTFTRA